MSASASAAEFTLGDALHAPGVVPACRTNDRLLATFKFAKAQLAAPDKCTVYRFVAKDDVQRKCFDAIVAASGKDHEGFLQSLGISDNPAEAPAFCKDGCNCQDTISYRTIE